MSWCGDQPTKEQGHFNNVEFKIFENLPQNQYLDTITIKLILITLSHRSDLKSLFFAVTLILLHFHKNPIPEFEKRFFIWSAEDVQYIVQCNFCNKMHIDQFEASVVTLWYGLSEWKPQQVTAFGPVLARYSQSCIMSQIWQIYLCKYFGGLCLG